MDYFGRRWKKKHMYRWQTVGRVSCFMFSSSPGIDDIKKTTLSLWPPLLIEYGRTPSGKYPCVSLLDTRMLFWYWFVVWEQREYLDTYVSIHNTRRVQWLTLIIEKYYLLSIKRVKIRSRITAIEKRDGGKFSNWEEQMIHFTIPHFPC